MKLSKLASSGNCLLRSVRFHFFYEDRFQCCRVSEVRR